MAVYFVSLVVVVAAGVAFWVEGFVFWFVFLFWVVFRGFVVVVVACGKEFSNMVVAVKPMVVANRHVENVGCSKNQLNKG